MRVLGALVEKELTTPDHYPLSLNALVLACNQTSNREPVMALSDGDVSAALDTVRRLGLVRSFQSSGSRVPRFQHLLVEAAELSRSEVAVFGALALRGPQTLAEIHTRAGRLVPNDNPDTIDAGLNALIGRTPPAAVRLPRRPGQKEARYANTLAGDVTEPTDAPAEQASAPAEGRIDRISALEELVRELQREVADLRGQLGEFRKQFE